MKLYISYYENYVSIVEGKYNHKKDKYIIKDYMFLSSEDVQIDYNDKYSLLREALRIGNWKVKDVILCLNTKDIIIKSNNIHKVNPKDLDGIMENEMDELMSLDNEQYIFSYEVTNETVINDRENLDVIIAAIRREEIEILIDLFREFKFNLSRVDTMSTAYSRILKKIEYDNIMTLNVGSYGSKVDIFKDDSLFIHDNIPIRINKQSNEYVYMELVEEIRGLMSFYSSRNFGNIIDTVVLMGQANENKEIINYFNNNFPSNIISGIENLFDIEEDIIGYIDTEDISKICDILGAMSLNYDKNSYYNMNLLPSKHKNKQRKADNLKQYMKLAPIALGIIMVPYIVFGVMNKVVNKKIENAQYRLDKILEEYKHIENIDQEITKAEEELDIYNMLLDKRVKWGDILAMINANIPYLIDLTNINVYYDSEYAQSQVDEIDGVSNNEVENVNEEASNEEIEEPQIPIYDQIPNVIVIDGEAKNTTYVGQFLYNLNKIPYFKSVELKSTTEDKEKGVHDFNIVLVLKEGVVSGK